MRKVISGVFFVAYAALAAGSGGVVIRPVANMYSAATEESDVVSQAIFGGNVGLLEQKSGWVKVKTLDDYAGWMPVRGLRLLKPGENRYAAVGGVAQVEGLFANVYREPDVTKHKPLLTLPYEARLELAGEAGTEEGRWLTVRLPDGAKAWIQRGDVAINPGTLSVDAAITLAKRFLGFPYLWGGTSSFGFDCSGLTQMLVRRRGVIMPRDAGPQAEWEGSVSLQRSNLQPGDLLFFGESAGKITHTGMYIGGGEFIHATTNTKPVVRISRLDDAPWAALLKICRRLK